MKTLTLSGSAGENSTNTSLLLSLEKIFPKGEFFHFNELKKLPLYTPDLDVNPLPKEVEYFRNQVSQSEAIIISTPEYIHGIPAILKNGLEWLTKSGELQGKRVLAITYTPHPPRGEKVMRALLWSLSALNANVVSSLSLYQTSIQIKNQIPVGDAEELELLKEAVRLLL